MVSKRKRGQQHPKAVLSDEDVTLMRRLHQNGNMGYRVLAKRFACGISTARDVCTYRTRML